MDTTIFFTFMNCEYTLSFMYKFQLQENYLQISSKVFMKKMCLLFLICFCCYQRSFSQTWTTYPKVKGWFTDIMRCMVEDDNGTYWIGSNNAGLFKFDGQNWNKAVDSTPEAIIDMMYVNGDIWTTGKGSILQIPQSNDSNIQVISYSTDPQSKYFRSIAYDSTGTIWVGGGDTLNTHLVSYKDGIWNEVDCKGLDKQSQITKIVVDASNKKWFISAAGLTCYNDTVMTTYNHTNSSLPDTELSQLEMDRNGDLWIGAGILGLYKYDGITFSNFTASTSILPWNFYITGIAFDKDNYLWISTYNSGVFRYDGYNWTVFNTSNSGIGSNMLVTVKIDRKNKKWFPTVFDGIVVYDDNATSVDEDENNSTLLLYPNPSTNVVTLQYSKKDNTAIKIFNSIGLDVTNQCNIQNSANGNITINVSAIPSGVYLVQESNKFGKFIR